jgi:outer membrane cobalamin receptor
MTGAEALPRVYVDNVSYGGIDALSNVQVSQIKEIRFVNARDATTQWGTGHMGGVILVITKR